MADARIAEKSGLDLSQVNNASPGTSGWDGGPRGVRAWIASLLVMAPSVASAQTLVEPPEGLFVTSREIAVELRDGLALVTHRVELESQGRRPREAHLRVPIPVGAGLASLEVCSGERCRSGVATGVGGVYEAARRGRRASLDPVAIAAIRHQAYRRGLFVEAAPIVAGRPFTITVRYVAAAPTEAGVTSFALPAPGHEPGSPPPIVRATAPDLEAVTIDGAPRPERSVVTIRARVPEGVARASAWSVRCGESRCSRVRVVAGPVPAPRREVFAIFDASPSARAADPEARAAAFGALLDALAPDARVTRVAFARRAALLDEAPRSAADTPRDAALPALGNTTRIGEAWALIGDRVRAADHPLVVLFGDGALGRDPTAASTLRALVDARAELSLVTLVDDRAVSSALTDAITATSGLSTIVLTADQRDRVPRLVAPMIASHLWLGRVDHGPLRAGEERVFETRHEGGGAVPVVRAFGRHVVPSTPRQRWADGFATRMEPDDPRAVLVAASPDQIEAASKDRNPLHGAGFGPRLVRRYPRIIVCRFGCGCGVRGSVSREAFGRMRARLRPAVTACFARARAGRPSWSARATLALVIEDGELVSSAVTQSTDPALNECLAHVADDFEDIPASSGAVAAFFPFVSPALAPAPSPAAVGPALDRALRDIGVEPSAVDDEELRAPVVRDPAEPRLGGLAEAGLVAALGDELAVVEDDPIAPPQTPGDEDARVEEGPR